MFKLKRLFITLSMLVASSGFCSSLTFNMNPKTVFINGKENATQQLIITKGYGRTHFKTKKNAIGRLELGSKENLVFFHPNSEFIINIDKSGKYDIELINGSMYVDSKIYVDIRSSMFKFKHAEGFDRYVFNLIQRADESVVSVYVGSVNIISLDSTIGISGPIIAGEQKIYKKDIIEEEIDNTIQVLSPNGEGN